MNMQNKFWLVWNETRDPPRHKHYSLDDAKREAERLARNNAGQQFHVLEFVGTCQKRDVEWVIPGDEITF